jgi:hypothetical protein
MRTIYHPDRASSYHLLPAGIQPDIDDVAVSFTSFHRDTPTGLNTAILGEVDLDTSVVMLNWGLGDGSSQHSELLSEMLGKRTGGSVMHHALNLSPSTILHIGAFGCADSGKGELDLTFLGGFYRNDHDSLGLPTEPTDEERRLVGKIVLASSLAFMELDGYSLCSLAFEFETSRQYEDLMAYGTLIQE